MWLNPHIAHRPSSTNLRSKLPGKTESSLSPASDNKDDFSTEVRDESGESITTSTTDDSIETESPELEEVNKSNQVNGETTGVFQRKDHKLITRQASLKLLKWEECRS